MARTLIASIHYLALSAKRNYRGEPYVIDAVSTPGSPPELTSIDDIMERDWGPITTGPGQGRRQELRYPEMGEVIARDLVREWTETGVGTNTTCHPGVWVIRDRLPVMKILRDRNNPNDEGIEVSDLDIYGKQVFRAASSEEKETMWKEDLRNAREADRRYAEYAFMDGNNIASDVRRVHLVPDTYKAAARFYGMEANWSKQGFELMRKPCPHCNALLIGEPMMCSSCAQPIDVKRWARYQADKERELREAKQLTAEAA